MNFALVQPTDSRLLRLGSSRRRGAMPFRSLPRAPSCGRGVDRGDRSGIGVNDSPLRSRLDELRAGDAHVCVELLFPGYGWLQFEPEAGTAHPNAAAATYLNSVAAAEAS